MSITPNSNLITKRARLPSTEEQAGFEEPTMKRQKVDSSLASQATCTPNSDALSLPAPALTQEEAALDMVRIVRDEFNCNHQAEAGDKTVEIFCRHQEEQRIENFLKDNITSQSSGLIYLCGHPGTGKTSLLNQILSTLKEETHYELFMFNAMTYQDVKQFSITLHQDLRERFSGVDCDRESRRVTDEEIAYKVAQALIGKNRKNQKVHKIIVIDEVD